MSRLTDSIKHIPRLPWGMLPAKLRLLFVTEDDQMAVWLKDAFASDAACSTELEVVVNPIFALEKLESHTFDVVVISNHGPRTLEWIEVIHDGAKCQPIQVLGKSADREFSALCFEAGADGFLTIDSMTIREILWHFARSSERRSLLRESAALRAAQEQQRIEAHQDVLSHLAEQQIILDVMGVECDAEQSKWIDQQLAKISTAHLGRGENLYQALENFIDDMSKEGVLTTQVIKSVFRSLQSAVVEIGPHDSRRVVDRSYVLLLELISKLETRRNRNEQSSRILSKDAA